MRIPTVVLSILIAVAVLGIGAAGSHAQVPHVQMYFNANLTQAQTGCQGIGVLQDVYVVFLNFNALISTVEFGVDFGNNFPLTYLGDIHNPGALFLGQSYQPGLAPDGVTINYPIPGNGFVPFVAMRIKVLWQCDDCLLDSPVLDHYIRVIPHETTGNLNAIEFATYRVIDGIGMTSVICPILISADERTWGQVKALYR